MSKWKAIIVDWSMLDDGTKAKLMAACVSGDQLDKTAIAECNNALICVQIASNSHVWPMTLEYLAKKSDSAYVRELVASNENTPIEALMVLAFDEISGVRNAVRSNPSTPEEVIQKMDS